jgi:cyclopropane fatty-acyl-phospholipid synthase-like methyltransferase
MNMNSFEGKRILALIRDGDYAHAGEEEAIEHALRSVPKNPRNWILDVGCGRGGTAEYLRRHGWGNLARIDRDNDSISYAKATYTDVEFHTCDVLDVPATVTREFDVIYMLNAFYAFADQRKARAALRKVAKPGARLVIFDYAIGGSPNETDLSVDGQVFIPHPIHLSGIGDLMRESGWEPGAIEDLSADYTRWYAAFVERIRRKQDEIEKVGGAEWCRFLLSMYSGLHDVIASGKLGGAIVRTIAV